MTSSLVDYSITSINLQPHCQVQYLSICSNSHHVQEDVFYLTQSSDIDTLTSWSKSPGKFSFIACELFKVTLSTLRCILSKHKPYHVRVELALQKTLITHEPHMVQLYTKPRRSTVLQTPVRNLGGHGCKPLVTKLASVLHKRL